MKYELVIFDLDGTALNTLDDLADACNATLRANGFPEHTVEEIRTYIGSGVSRLIRAALPEQADEATHARVLMAFKAYYNAHLIEKTRPYPDIPELMQSLRSMGVHVAVHSNKMDPAVQALCGIYFADLVEMAVGESEESPRKPSPVGAQKIMRRFQVSPDRTLYVGDSDVDLMTAQNAGVEAAWVSWGFRRREELGDRNIKNAFDTVEALRAFIER